MTFQRPCNRFFGRHLVYAAFILFIGMIVVAGVAQTPPAPPQKQFTPEPLPPGWDQIDERLVFLTVRLSSVEASVTAVDKAIKATGYSKASKQDDVEHARKGNELMDRKGGGPVPWQDFYGRTATDFYFHPGDAVHGHVISGSLREADIQAQHTDTPVAINRPPQLDYIYRANSDNQKRAEQAVAELGGKIDKLLERRRSLESEQSALWSEIAFQAVASRDLSSKPLYRFNLKTSQQDQSADHVAAAGAACDFVRTISQLMDDAQKGVENDPGSVFHQFSVAVGSARKTLNDRLAEQESLALDLSDGQSKISKVSAAAKRLDELAKNLDDSYRLAHDGDVADDDQRKNTFRGQLQDGLLNTADTVITADQCVLDVVKDWKLTPDVKKPATQASLHLDVPASSGGSDGGENNPSNPSKAEVRRAGDRTLTLSIDTEGNASFVIDSNDSKGKAPDAVPIPAQTRQGVEAVRLDQHTIFVRHDFGKMQDLDALKGGIRTDDRSLSLDQAAGVLELVPLQGRWGFTSSFGYPRSVSLPLRLTLTVLPMKKGHWQINAYFPPPKIGERDCVLTTSVILSSANADGATVDRASMQWHSGGANGKPDVRELMDWQSGAVKVPPTVGLPLTHSQQTSRCLLTIGANDEIGAIRAIEVVSGDSPNDAKPVVAPDTTKTNSLRTDSNPVRQNSNAGTNFAASSGELIPLLSDLPSFQRTWKKGDKRGALDFDRDTHTVRVDSAYALGGFDIPEKWSEIRFSLAVESLSFGRFDIDASGIVLKLGDAVKNLRGGQVRIVYRREDGVVEAYVDNSKVASGTVLDAAFPSSLKIGFSSDGGQNAKVAFRDIQYRAAGAAAPGPEAAGGAQTNMEGATEFNGHLYKVILEKKSWEDAEKSCEALGGHLAIVKTDELRQFLASTKHGKVVWIGCRKVDGKWRWIDQTEGPPDHLMDSDHDFVAFTVAADFRTRPVDGKAQFNPIAGYICEWDKK